MFVNGSHEDVKCVFEMVMFPAETVLKASLPTWQVGQVGRVTFAAVQWICGWKRKARDKESDKGQCTTETALDIYCNDGKERANGDGDDKVAGETDKGGRKGCGRERRFRTNVRMVGG